MLGEKLLFVDELALQLLDGCAHVAMGLCAWALLQLLCCGLESGSQARQLGFVFFLKAGVDIGSSGLGLLEVEFHQSGLRQQDVYLIEQKNRRIGFLKFSWVHKIPRAPCQTECAFSSLR